MSVSFLKKSEFAALAAALALVGVSGEAYAQDGRGRWNAGAQADAANGGAEMRQQRQEARQAQQQQRQSQRAEAQAQRQAQRAQVPSEPNWQGRGRAANAPRWGSQRPADGQSYGRDRSAGAVTRPAPAWRGATPAAPQAQAPAQQAEATVGRYRDRNRDGARERNWDSTRRDGSTVQAPRNRTYRDASREDRDRGTWNDNDRNRGTWNRNDRDRGGWNDSDRNRQAWRDGSQRRWDRDNWRRDNRYDWQRYRNQNRSVFRIGVYSSPYRNWSYRRLGIGTALNSLFFSSRYWIQDPWQYRLPEVYGPYRWVRYYDDVLLVDIYSGEVVDVIYNFFW